MKKIKLVFLTTVSFIALSVTILTACKKTNEVETTKTSNSSNQSKTISGSIDLENYETNIVHNEDGTTKVYFSEPDDINFEESIAEGLGFESLSIASGIYSIDVDSKGVSVLEFPIDSYVGTGATSTITASDIMGSGVRIARRHSTHEGCTRTDCVCGIGFRCGFHHDTSSPKFADAGIDIVRDGNHNPTSIRITFTEVVDWEAMM